MMEWFSALSALGQAYALIAIPSTLLLIVYIILLAFGIGGHDADTDVDADIDADTDITIDADADADTDIAADTNAPTHADSDSHSGLKWFSVLGIFACLSIAGWGGLAMLGSGLSGLLAVPMSIIMGVGAMLLCGKIIQLFSRMTQSGNISLQSAVGLTGEVYVRIPPAREFPGKVSVTVQERLCEFEAVTDDHEPISTGSEVYIVSLADASTLLVHKIGAK